MVVTGADGPVELDNMSVYDSASFYGVGSSVYLNKMDTLGLVKIENSGSATVSDSYLSGLTVAGLSSDVKIDGTNF